MEPFSPSVHDDPRHLSLSLSLPLWFSPLVRPVPVAVYKSGRRLYPPTTLHRMEQRGGGYRGGPEEREGGGVRGHTIRVPTASGVTRCCNLRRIVAEIRDWNRGRVMNRTDVFPALFQFPFAVSVFFFFFFFYYNRPLSPASLLDLTARSTDRADIANLILHLFLCFWIFLFFY